MLCFRGGAERFEADNSAQLESGGADTASSSVNEQGLACADMGEAVKHLVGGDVVKDETDGFGGIEIGGDRNEMRFGDDSKLGIASNHGEGGDALAD